MASQRPTAFGPYAVLNLIGSGGMARVYRCADTRNGAIVAVKALRQPSSAEESALRRFEREIQTMQQVSHPYIVPVLDYSLTPTTSYLVMPYFAGGSVADRLGAQLYTPQEAARLLAHLAHALDYAHSQGYIHRDLKPSNLLLDERGQAYLSDFGLAKAIGVGQLAGEALAFGTAAYMAPELFDGARPDVRSDVYALGIMLCELLTGHRPFEAGDSVTYRHLHRRAMPPAPGQLNPDLPASLNAVVLQALSKSPAERPQSAGELARQFGAAVAALPEAQQQRAAAFTARRDLVLMPVSTGQAQRQPATAGPRRTLNDDITLISRSALRPPPAPRHSASRIILLALLALAALLVTGSLVLYALSQR